MGVGRSSSAARGVALGWLVAGCATPIREDPPSNLGATDSVAGDVTSGSDGPSSANTGSGSPTATSSSSSETSSGSSMGGASSTSSDDSTSSTSGGSAGSSGTGGGGSVDTTDGTGGSSTESTTETNTTTGASTTGGVVIPDELPWVDDFENYTPDAPAAPNWTALESSGGWRVFSDGTTQVYGPASEASNRNMTYVDGPVWTDMRLEVELRLMEGGDATRIYIAVRATPAGSKLDYYHAYVRGDGNVRLGKYVGGSTTEERAAVETGVPLESGVWHTLALSIVGDTLSVELDGDPIDSGTIDGRESGSIALGVDQGIAEFDNLSVTAP